MHVCLSVRLSVCGCLSACQSVCTCLSKCLPVYLSVPCIFHASIILREEVITNSCFYIVLDETNILTLFIFHSVYSAGEGFGSTFTLRIPLIDSPIISPAESTVADSTYPSRRNSEIMTSENLFKTENDNENSSLLLQKVSHENAILILNKSDSNSSFDDVADSVNFHSSKPFSSPCNKGHLNVENDMIELSNSLYSIQPPMAPSHLDIIPHTTESHDTGSHPTGSQPTGPNIISSSVLSSPAKDYMTSRIFKILVVDDSKLNRRMLIKCLKANSHICDEAEDGVEAVEKVRKTLIDGGLYDAILMDFMMPIMDGPTATQLIRELGYIGIIIGVTGNALPSDINHFTVSGANCVLLKPVDMDALEGSLFCLLGSTLI